MAENKIIKALFLRFNGGGDRLPSFGLAQFNSHLNKTSTHTCTRADTYTRAHTSGVDKQTQHTNDIPQL